MCCQYHYFVTLTKAPHGQPILVYPEVHVLKIHRLNVNYRIILQDKKPRTWFMEHPAIVGSCCHSSLNSYKCITSLYCGELVAFIFIGNLENNTFLFYLLASLANSNSSLQTREKLYLLAVGYYRNGDYPRSRQLVDHCLEVCLSCFLST